jgi:DNA repair protein RadC
MPMYGEKLVALVPAADLKIASAPLPRGPILQYSRPTGGLPLLRLPRDVAAYLRTAVPPTFDDPREHAYVLSLSTKNRLLTEPYLLSIGRSDQCDFDPREVFRFALVAGGSAIIMAHTHPSGDCTPSEQDKHCTERIKTAGTVLGIALLDHLILGGAHREEETAKYFSFKEGGLI